MTENVTIEVTLPYVGSLSKNVRMNRGKHRVSLELAEYLVKSGHAVYVDEPKTEPETKADETPKRKIAKTKRKKTDTE